MKILLCHNFYRQPGGEQVAVLALKSLLEQKGHTVLFYTADNREVDQYNNLEKMAFFPQTLFSRRTYREMLGVAARERPDIAHVHNVFPLLSPSLYIALNQARIPIVQSIHNYRLMCINGLFLREGNICEKCKTGNFLSGYRFKCYRESHLLSALYALTLSFHRRIRTFGRIDHFIASTEFVAQKLVESSIAEQSKISVLGNFLLEPFPMYGKPDLTHPYVVYVGRLSREKGIFTLLRSFQEMGALQLKVIGSGPLQSAVQMYIQERHLNNIEILGYVNEEEKYRILRDAICCAQPSECYEVFPMVLLESAAVGTPIVASRIGSLATLISEGRTGVLFSPGDSSDLRAKLEGLVAEPEVAIRMGEQARLWVEAEHTADAHYHALMRIYEQAMP